MNYPRCFQVILLISYLMAQSLMAQVTGLVVDEAGQPVEAANVLIMRLPDTTLVKGQVSDRAGSFVFNSLSQGEYLTQIRMVGYETYVSAPYQWKGPGTEIALGKLALTLRPIEADVVEITAERQLFEQKIDRLVVNVSNSITAAGNTALEVLERAPGVILDRGNNNLSLAGKEGVIVMINGKRNYMPIQGVIQMLAGMSADQIEKIELITTPPANFDAEGNAGYINIVLKENSNYGFNGSFNSSIGYGRGLLTNNGVNFNYRRNKINLYGDYTFSVDRRDQLFTSYREYQQDDETVVFDTRSDRFPQQLNHNLRVGLDYQLTPKTIVGVLASGYDNEWTMDALTVSEFTYANQPDTLIELDLFELNHWQHFMSNLNVQHSFTPSTILTFNADYLFYQNNNPTTYQNTYMSTEREFFLDEEVSSEKETPIQIGVGSLDLEFGLGDKGKVNTGIKATITRFTNDVGVAYFRDEWKSDPSLTGIFFLEEEIGAAYASMDYQLGPQTSAKLGLRYEYTESNLGSETEQNIVDRKYGNLFPSVFISQKIGANQGVNFSYSRRISRPTFNQMAPFIIFMDPQTFFSGNAALQPSISNAVKLDYRIKTFMLSLSYTYEDSAITQFQVRVDPETGRQIINAENTQGIHTANLSATLPLKVTDWWEMQFNLSGSWNQINAYLSGELLTFEQWTFNGFGAQRFKLPQQIGIEVSGFYRSPTRFGTSLVKGFGGLNVGLRKGLGRNGSKGTISLNGQDLLNSIQWTATNDLPEFNLITRGLYDFSQRTFIVGYTYNFGSNTVRAARNRQTGSEEERGRVD